MLWVIVMASLEQLLTLAPSSCVKGSVRTETASVGLELIEQSSPQLCAHSKGMYVTVPLFLCDVYDAMNTGVFLCSPTTKNTFKEKKVMSWLQSDKSCNGELFL